MNANKITHKLIDYQESKTKVYFGSLDECSELTSACTNLNELNKTELDILNRSENENLTNKWIDVVSGEHFHLSDIITKVNKSLQSLISGDIFNTSTAKFLSRGFSWSKEASFLINYHFFKKLDLLTPSISDFLKYSQNKICYATSRSVFYIDEDGERKFFLDKTYCPQSIDLLSKDDIHIFKNIISNIIIDYLTIGRVGFGQIGLSSENHKILKLFLKVDE